MKKAILLIAACLIAAPFIAFSDESTSQTTQQNDITTTPVPESGSASNLIPAENIPTILASSTTPQRRTNYRHEAFLAKFAESSVGEVVVLEAGCGGEAYTDNSYNDVTNNNPKYWTSWTPDGKEILFSDFEEEDTSSVPEAIKAKIKAIAEYQAEKDAKSTTIVATAG